MARLTNFSLIILIIFCAISTYLPSTSIAATRTVTPRDNIQAAVNALAAGDTLLFADGVYTRKTALYFKNLTGKKEQPIVVGPAPGAHAVIQLDSTYTKFVIQDWDHNNIHVQKCHYLEIYGFEITAGRTGIETEYKCSHCTFRDLEIHHVGNVGIRIASGSSHHMKLLGNHIHHTYLHGEGYYIGDNDGSSKINNTIFEGNYIHHTSLLKDQGDGVELKKGCWGNTIRYNVMHDTHYPGILVWGTGRKDPKYNNKVYCNLVFRSVGGEHGVQLASEVDFFNNIVIDGGNRNMYTALSSNENLKSGMPMNNIRIYNNTFYGAQRGVSLWDWEGKKGMVFSNNVIYCLNQEDEALNTNNKNLHGVDIQGNYYYGEITGDGFQPLIGKGIKAGPPAAEVFARPENDITLVDLYPLGSSAIVNAAKSEWTPDDDFNNNARPSDGAPDSGAFEFITADNPGWAAPNMLKPSSDIEFTVPEGTIGGVTLAVYDVSGRRVRMLADSEISPGTHTVTWDGRFESGRRAVDGFYFLRLDTGDGYHTRRVILLK